MSGFAEWVLKLKADSSGVKSGVNSAISDIQRLADAAERQMQKAFDRQMRYARALASVAAGSASSARIAKVGAIALGAGSIVEGAMFLNLAAKTAFGLNAQSVKEKLDLGVLQRLKAASNVSGSSVTDLIGGFKGVSGAIDAARGGDETATKNLQALGITLDEIRNQSAEDTFFKIARGMDAATLSSEKFQAALDVGLGPVLDNLRKGVGDVPGLVKFFEVNPGDIQVLTELEVRIKNITQAVKNLRNLSTEIPKQAGLKILTGLGGAVVSLTNRFAASVVGASAYLPFGEEWKKKRLAEAEALQMQVEHQRDQNLPLSENDLDPETARLTGALETAQTTRSFNEAQADAENEDAFSKFMDDFFAPNATDAMRRANERKLFRLQMNSVTGAGRKRLLSGEIDRIKREMAGTDSLEERERLRGELLDAQNEMATMDTGGSSGPDFSPRDVDKLAQIGLYTGGQSAAETWRQTVVEKLGGIESELRDIKRLSEE